MLKSSKILRSGFAALAVLAGAATVAQAFLPQPAFARSDSRDLRDHRDRDVAGKSDRQHETRDRGDR